MEHKCNFGSGIAFHDRNVLKVPSCQLFLQYSSVGTHAIDMEMWIMQSSNAGKPLASPRQTKLTKKSSREGTFNLSYLYNCILKRKVKDTGKKIIRLFPHALKIEMLQEKQNSKTIIKESFRQMNSHFLGKS